MLGLNKTVYDVYEEFTVAGRRSIKQMHIRSEGQELLILTETHVSLSNISHCCRYADVLCNSRIISEYQ